MSGSKHPNSEGENKNGKALPQSTIVLVIAAVLLIAGVVYVFGTKAQKSPTSNPAASVTVTNEPASNFTLPKSAQLTGKPACSNESRMQVLLFTDPYCPACAVNQPKVSKFYQKYKEKAEVQYRLVSTHSRSLSRIYGINETYQAHDYFVCAQEQDKIEEFIECFYKQLATKNGDYIPQNKTQLDLCAEKASLDRKKLEECLPEARAKVDADIMQAADFGGGTFFTPMAVIDCRYRVNSVLAEETLCALSDAC